MPRRKKTDYAELCDVLRIKINAARAAQADQGAHAGKSLTEPVTPLTDTGVRTGDPRAAERRRLVELESATGTGTVLAPVKKDGKGRAKLTVVEASEDNVRRALTYWKKRRAALGAALGKRGEFTASDSTRQCDDMIADMHRRLAAMAAGGGVLDARRTDVAAVYRGPTLVRGRAMEAAVVTGPRERGDKPVATSLEGPLGRERFDKTITDVPAPKVAPTPTQRRAWRRKQAKAHRTTA